MKSKLCSFLMGCAAIFAAPFFECRARAHNVGEGTHERAISKTADNAIATRYLLAKFGTDADHIDKCGAADLPLGPCVDEPAAGDLAAVHLLGHGATKKMIASGVIAAGDRVYTDASGKVQTTPTTTGVFWLVGTALSAAAADGDVIEVHDCVPQRVQVMALPGNVNSEISGLSFSSTPTQAEANALRDKCEELADDFRALATAITTDAAQVLWLAS